MVERIKAVEDEALVRLKEVKNLQELEAVRIRYVGKKGLITELVKNLKNIPAKERPHFGKNLNITKNKLESLIKEKRNALESVDKQKKIKSSAIDITMPGKGTRRGKIHPITQVMDEVIDILIEGEKQAKTVAEETMSDVHIAMNFG